jgi:hypothetical protein
MRMSGELAKAVPPGRIAIAAWGTLPSIMTKKARKHEFLVDFVLDRKYRSSFMSLMELERGVFYPIRENLGIHDQRAETLELAWAIDPSEPDYRILIFRDWKDLWISQAICNYPAYAEQAERQKRESS